MTGAAQELKAAIALVETKAMAPLARVAATKPKKPMGREWQQWARRREEAEAYVVALLTEQGASVAREWDCASITFHGQLGSSRTGLLDALKRWKMAAEMRLRTL